MKQNKKRYISIGGGFPANSKYQTIIVPKDRFTAFLNVDVESIDAIYEYFNSYQLIILGKDRIDKFRQEQDKIKKLLNKVVESTLNENDLEYISTRISSIKKHLRFSNENALIEVNENILNKPPKRLDNFTQLKSKTKQQHIITTKTSNDPFAYIYEYLVEIILENRSIKTCPNCGIFYIPNKNTPWQKFCSEICKIKNRDRRKYLRNK